MINNFWIDKYRDKQFMKYSDLIAKRNKITISEFRGLSRPRRVELLEEFLKDEEKRQKLKKKRV